jgi:hypothetical protein
LFYFYLSLKLAWDRQKRIQERIDFEEFEEKWRTKDPPPAYEQPPSYNDAIINIQTIEQPPSYKDAFVNVRKIEQSTLQMIDQSIFQITNDMKIGESNTEKTDTQTTELSTIQMIDINRSEVPNVQVFFIEKPEECNTDKSNHPTVQMKDIQTMYEPNIQDIGIQPFECHI